MNDLMWLECEVKSESTKELELIVTLQDGTTTIVKARPTETAKKGAVTYLKVESMGSKNGLTYITLPVPSLQHGRNVTVRADTLIRDLNKKTIGEVISERKKK